MSNNSVKLSSNEQRATSNEQRANSYPLISVIVPVYKVEKYLDQCVNSIVNQTYTNLEIILVDDGSPDNCPAMCDEWAHRDSRIRVIHKTNGGLDTARNAGLDVMRGEFVGTVDSDDFIAPNMYERLYTLLIENDADISVCGLVQVDEEGNKLSKQPEPMKDEVLSREDMFNKFLNGTANVNYCYSWNKIYRAKIFREIRFIGGVHEDTATIHRIIGESRKIVVSSEKLHFYRRSKDSITGKMARQKFWCKSYMGHLEAFRDRYTYFMSIGRPDIADKVSIAVSKCF